MCDAWVPMIAQLFIFGRRLGTIHLLSNTRNRRHCLAQAMSHKLLEFERIQYRNITVLGLFLHLFTDF